MFDKKDKRRLYWLIDSYLSGKITARVFCDEFYYSYDIEINSDLLTKLEEDIFSQLSIVSSRFSEFEKDHKKHPKAFFTEKDLKQKIIEVKEKLTSPDNLSGQDYI